jgi:hypothetical protein
VFLDRKYKLRTATVVAKSWRSRFGQHNDRIEDGPALRALTCSRLVTEVISSALYIRKQTGISMLAF